MASGGGEFSSTLLGGHEPFYDFSCSLCEGEGRNVEAVKYCEECLVYLCDPCLTNHNKFPLNRRHQLLDQGQFAATKKSAIVSFPTKRCTKHPGELINIYCGKHDVVCCSVCRTFEHSVAIPRGLLGYFQLTQQDGNVNKPVDRKFRRSKCQGTEHLPDAARDVHKSKEYRNMKAETTSLISEINDAIYNENKDISRIAKEKQQSRETIKEFRRKTKQYFDDLEKKSLDEVEEKEEKITGDIKQRIEHLKKSKQEAEETLKQLESTKKGNECELFYHLITGKQFVHDTQYTIQRMLDSNKEASVSYEMNKDIERYVSSLSSFGSFVENRAVGHGDVSNSAMTTASEETSNSPTDKAKCSDHAVTYSNQIYGRFNIKDKSDKDTCYITDICQLADGSYLVVDFNNETIKRLDSKFKLLQYVQLAGGIDGICSVSNNEVAVSLCFATKIQFLSVGKTLKLTKMFDVGMYCRGLCHVNGKLVICCGDFNNPTSTSCIKVYNTKGRLLNTIPHTPRYLTKTPWYITASDDGQNLFVTSFESNDITILDMNGNIINTFRHKELRQPSGICSDGTGNVFVCGLSSNNVFMLSPWQQQMEVILTGIDAPRSIYFDKTRSLLMIGCCRSGDIAVFSMKKNYKTL